MPSKRSCTSLVPVDELPTSSSQLARKWGSNSRRQDRPNLYYSIKAPDGSEVFPKLPNGEDGCWRWSPVKMKTEVEMGNIEFLKEGKEWVVYEKIYEPKDGEVKTKKYSSWLDDVGSSSTGTKEVQDLFDGKSPFDHPKPTTLIKRLMAIADINEGDTVLDFFAGSGSTAEACLSYNIDNNFNAKFVLVQIPEKVDDKKEAGRVALSLGLRTISEVCEERVRRVCNKILTETLLQNKFDLGFKVFKLEKSNYKIWENYEGQNTKELIKQLELFKSPLINNYKNMDVIYESIIKEGLNLNSEIEELKIKTNKVYEVKDSFSKFYICLDDKINDKTLEELKVKKDDLLICLDNSLDDSKKVNLALQCKLKTI